MEARKRKDLNDLGVLLYLVLGDHFQQTGHENETATNKESSKRGKRQQVPRRINLPMYRVSLIASLLTPILNQGGDLKVFYSTSARDVLADLQLADEKSNIYLMLFSSTDLVSRPVIFFQCSLWQKNRTANVTAFV